MESQPSTTEQPSAGKRPRSPSGDSHPVASKVPKTHSNHLQINYLARQYPDNLPLVSVDDNMPSIMHLVGEYDGVLQRHESIAGNLGACPLGPILIKRFERLFDGPPRVLKSHGKDAHAITWLDVVEFAKSKPEQFNLEKTRNGVRVCQFYTKQCRVEISEEDFVLIASGMPQKMIPPQPIIEDEEKELGALEILEKNLQQIVSVADQVSARARQLNHRLKNRRTAIVARRENDASLHSTVPRPLSPWREANGLSSPSGFVAVNSSNSRQDPIIPADDTVLSSQFNTDNVTIINGTSIKGASPTTRAELMKKFFTTADRQARGYEDPPGGVQVNRQSSSRPRPRASDAAGEFNLLNSSSPTTVAIPNTPSSLLPPPKSNHPEKDDGGPHKMEMVARMEELQRGERILPPCDRCRRLHMDCLKNLTACMGCTKKHAKCSWKDVKDDELHETRTERHMSHEVSADEANKSTVPSSAASSSALAPVQAPVTTTSAAPATPPAVPARTANVAPVPASAQGPGSAPAHAPALSSWTHHADSTPTNFNTRRESAPITAQSTTLVANADPSPRRAMSEVNQGNTLRPSRPEDDDPDANQRLMQAIWDTVDHHARGTATTTASTTNTNTNAATTPATSTPAMAVTAHSVPVSRPEGTKEVSSCEREQEREQKMVKA